jgi:predicted membrane protein
MSRNSQRGEGRLKLMITLIVIISVVYLMFKIVPAYVNDYQLKDTLTTEGRFQAARQKTEEQVRNSIWKEIQELGVPAKREDIQIQTSGRSLRISVKYTVVVDLPGYQLNLNFNTNSENPII